MLESATSCQLAELNTLSDQLTATATVVKDFGNSPHHSHSHSDESTRDRSASVVVFGVNENSDRAYICLTSVCYKCFSAYPWSRCRY